MNPTHHFQRIKTLDTMDPRESNSAASKCNKGESAIGESSEEEIDDATIKKKPRTSSLNNLNQGSSRSKLRADPSDDDSEEDTIPDDYAMDARKMSTGEDGTGYDYKNKCATSFPSSGNGSKQRQQQSESKGLPDSDINPKAGAGRDERRMEANRVRARDIRKRKKTMVEEMKKKIVKLTMANQQLIRQTQMQNAEIHMLRSMQAFMPQHSVGIAC